MSDKMAKLLSKYIDNRINNKRENRESNITNEEIDKIEDQGTVELIEKLLKADFTFMSKIKDILEDKISERIKNGEFSETEEGELDFNDLDQVAGGLNKSMDDIKKNSE